MQKLRSIKDLGIYESAKVLLIYPHPDDETFCNGGMIQRLVNNNVQTYVLSLTKGEASTLSFSTSRDKLSEIRKNEFESVMKFLGVSNYFIKDFCDGKLNEETDQIRKLINESIVEIQPNFVFTYEPSGIYGHPDHIIVSKIVTEISKSSNFKLIYSTVNKNYKSSASTLKMSEDPSNIRPLVPNIQFRLTTKEYLKKLKALKMYKSQVSIRHEFLHKIYQALAMPCEYYSEKQ